MVVSSSSVSVRRICSTSRRRPVSGGDGIGVAAASGVAAESGAHESAGGGDERPAGSSLGVASASGGSGARAIAGGK